jgi:hypothetical protein
MYEVLGKNKDWPGDLTAKDAERTRRERKGLGGECLPRIARIPQMRGLNDRAF